MRSHPHQPSRVQAGRPAEESGHLSPSLLVYLAPRCQWCCACVLVCVFWCMCVCAGGWNVLPTLGASGALVRWWEPQDYWSKERRLGSTHYMGIEKEGGREISNRARPRYQRSGHLFGGGLPSAVRPCQSEEKGASRLLWARWWSNPSNSRSETWPTFWKGLKGHICLVGPHFPRGSPKADGGIWGSIWEERTRCWTTVASEAHLLPLGRLVPHDCILINFSDCTELCTCRWSPPGVGLQ